MAENVIPHTRHTEIHEAFPHEGTEGWIKEDHPGYDQLVCSRKEHFYTLAVGVSNPGGFCGDIHCGQEAVSP